MQSDLRDQLHDAPERTHRGLSASDQGPPWPARWWHSRSPLSSGSSRCVPALTLRANYGRLRSVSRYANLRAAANHLVGYPFFVEMLSMAYLLQPVNCPYDPEEPMPTRLGFIVDPYPAGFADDWKRRFTPVPRDVVHKAVNIVSDVPWPDFLKEAGDVDGDRPMPDFFWIAADHYYCSSRFRAVLERYAGCAVEYIEVLFNMPASRVRLSHITSSMCSGVANLSSGLRRRNAAGERYREQAVLQSHLAAGSMGNEGSAARASCDLARSGQRG